MRGRFRQRRDWVRRVSCDRWSPWLRVGVRHILRVWWRCLAVLHKLLLLGYGGGGFGWYVDGCTCCVGEP